MRWCRDLLDALGRRKPWDARSLKETDFRRSLNALDLVAIGVGSSAGVGIYVLSAHVTKEEAGPSSVLSVILASVAALLAGLCQAELAGRLPRAGTSYTYCYVALGELCAFVVGWGLLLEHILVAAMAAKAWGQYLDFMLNDTVTSQMERITSWKLPEPLAPQPDVLGMALLLLATLAALMSVKAFSVLMFVLTALSGLVLMAFVSVGYFHVQAHNWTQPPGFFANGLSGMMSGAALLVAMFSGLNHVAGASQESREPCRQVPTAISASLAVLFISMLLATTALTLACPWQELASRAPLARAFETKGIYAANDVIGTGALLGLLAAVLGGLFHPPRLLNSMAADGLLPRWVGRVSLAATPVVGGLLCGVFASVLALVLDFRATVEMLAMATALQFLTSAFIVLFVRYQPEPVGLCREYTDLDLSLTENSPPPPPPPDSPKLLLMVNGDVHVQYNRRQDGFSPIAGKAQACRTHGHEYLETSAIFSEDGKRAHVVKSSSVSSFVQLPASTKMAPDAASWQTTRYLLLVFLLAASCLAATSLAWPMRPASSWWAVTLACVSTALMVAAGLGVARQPQSTFRLYFRAPYVPLLPLLSLLLSTLLLASLPLMAWLRFTVWTALGLVLYFLYGIRHSVHRSHDDQEVVLFDISSRTY